MRQLWVTCVVLVLLAGCAYHSSATQDAAYKIAFVHQLVGYCANVDRQLAGVSDKTNPGKYAQQLGNFASQARSHRAPSTQRQQLNVLLTAFDDASRQYRSAQVAQASGNTSATERSSTT